MDRARCPHCKKFLISPYGNPKSKILFVGEFPGWEEVKQGIPFIGKTGDVLRAELLRNGIQLGAYRVTNLWLHEQDEENCKAEWHLDQLVKEFKGKTHVLLMGSSVVNALVGKQVSNYAGMQVKLPDFKGIRFWVSPNPAVVFHGPLGELRMSLERFVHDINRN